MIIELAGLPGAGKSTFARRLEKEGFTLVLPPGRARLLLWNALFLLRHPVAFLRTFIWLTGHLGASGRWRLKVANLFFVHNAKYMIASRLSRAVIDQGYFQNIVSLFDEPLAEEALARYAAALPKPDLLVLFDVPKAEREARMEKRGYGVRGWEDAGARERWLTAAETNYAALLRLRLNNMLPFPSVVQDGGDDKGEIGYIKRSVWYYVMNARMPTEKAHGLQIAKSCEALARTGEPVALWVPRREGGDPTNIAAYYGLGNAFSVRMFATPTFAIVPQARSRFALQSAVFALSVAFTRLDREGVYVTRNVEIAWLLAWRGCRVVYEAHVFPASKRALFARLLRNVALIVCNSHGTEAAYRTAGFVNTVVLQNGVDLEQFSVAVDRDHARRALGLPRAKRIVLYTGAFYRWKGVPHLLDAWRRGGLAERDDLLLVLVGGTMADLAREGAGGDAAAVLNLLVVPHQSTARMPMYLAAADLLVLPNAPETEESIRFTSPIKMFEYMASGRPIVASGLPSIREVVSAEEAVFARAGDSADLAAKIVELLADPARGDRLARAARAKAQRFDWRSRAERLKDALI